MKKFFRTILLVFTIGVLFASGSVMAMTRNNNDGLFDLTLSPQETLHLGFQFINGNVHDRYGNLFIELCELGFTPWGTRLAADFSIVYASDFGSDEEGISLMRTDVFNGGMNVNQNTSGNQGSNVGEAFRPTRAEPSVEVSWSSGPASVTGVNFGLTNTTRGTEHTWINNLSRNQVDNSTWSNVFNSANENDNFRVRVSAEGGSGHVNLRVRTVR